LLLPPDVEHLLHGKVMHGLMGSYQMIQKCKKVKDSDSSFVLHVRHKATACISAYVYVHTGTCRIKWKRRTAGSYDQTSSADLVGTMNTLIRDLTV